MMIESDELIRTLNQELTLSLPLARDMEEIRHSLAAYVNSLINENFEKLIFILYRVDVSESRLRNLLRDRPVEDAGLFIADLIIERQLQKIKSRQEHRRDKDISEEDKW